MFLALFGIDDGALNLVVNLLVLFLVAVWLALVFWTYRDAKQRIEDPVLVMTATAASAIPFAGTVVYTILRPPEYLEDARERALEIEAAELRVKQLRDQACPSCEHPVSRDFLRCPNCQVRLKDPCPSCSEPVDPRWTVCPFCEQPLRARQRRPGGSRGSAAPPREGASRRSETQRGRQTPAPASQNPSRSGSSQGGARGSSGSRAALGSGRTPGSSSSRSGSQRTTGGRQSSAGSSERPGRTSRTSRSDDPGDSGSGGEDRSGPDSS